MKHTNVPVLPIHQRRLDAESNALLQKLLAATPAEVHAHMESLETLAQTHTVLTALALGIRHLYLKEHR